MEEFTFLQITDLHVDVRDGRVNAQILREDLRRLMTNWSDKAAFVAVTGDLTTHAEVQELVDARQVLSEQPLPIFPLPGNHDLRGEGGTERYLDHFGPDSYSFDWGPVTLSPITPWTMSRPHSPHGCCRTLLMCRKVGLSSCCSISRSATSSMRL